MANFPFDYPEKMDGPNKITRAQESKIFSDIQGCINSLVARCNLKNTSSIEAISLVIPEVVSRRLTAEEFDSNMDKIESTLNALIQNSEHQGLNPQNMVKLHKRRDQETPLLIWHRDTNYSTIQIAINSIHTLYAWDGA